MTDAWKAENTNWGKLAVIIFYVYIWIGVVGGTLSVIAPSVQGGECFLTNLEPNQKQAVLALMRVESLFFVFFFLFLEMHKTHICNVTILALVMLLSYCLMRGPLKALNAECWQGTRETSVTFSFVPLAIWIMVMVEYWQGRRHQGGTSGEAQPLVT